MDEREIRLRCIEAAASCHLAPVFPREQGPAAGVLEVAKAWAEWVAPPPSRTARRSSDAEYLQSTKSGVADLY